MKRTTPRPQEPANGMTTEHTASPPNAPFHVEVPAPDIQENKPSMLYNVLPFVVQNRIPRLPSLRRTLSDMRSPASQWPASKNHFDTALPGTPPPDYTSRPISVASSQCSDGTSLSPDEDDAFREAPSVRSAASTLSTPPPFQVSESKTGIQWRYASSGVTLSTQAYAESQSHRADEISTALTRQMYIHGVTYLLRGLPDTLSPEELASIQSALPPTLAPSTPCNHDMLSSLDPSATASQRSSNPSLLHRITATLIFESFVLLHFILPYLKLLLAYAYRFERRHNVTQRLVNNGLVTADAMRRAGLHLTHTVCQMNDGKVGQALGECVLWWVRSVTGGMQDGVREGVKVLREEKRER